MKKSLFFCLSIALIFILSCNGCCKSKPKITTDRLCLELGQGVWPADYSLSGCSFNNNKGDFTSVDIEISKVAYNNGVAYPVGGNSTLTYDFSYLQSHDWCIEVWKEEFIAKITMVQTCNNCCNVNFWQQTGGGNVTVSCYVAGGSLKNGKTQWSFYNHVTSVPISTLVVNPTFVKCVDCGCL